MKSLTPAVVASLALLALAGGCKKATQQGSYQGYIVGVGNDIVPITKENEGSVPPRVLGASVLLATRSADGRVKFCSGVIIAPEGPTDKPRVLSNHHCFAQTIGESDVSTELMPEACIGTHVYFSLIRDEVTRETKFGTCLKGSLRTHFDADVAVFQLGEMPPPETTSLTLWSGVDPATDRKALLVHYPDLTENLVTLSSERARLPAAAMTVNDCKTLSTFDQSQWKLDHSLPYGLQHTCDLVHGSSGSALVDADTQTILGLNWGGIKVKIGQDTLTYNVATRARYINAFLHNDIQALSNPVKIVPSSNPASIAGSSSGEQPQEEKSDKDLAGAIKNVSCGTLGAESGPLSNSLFLLIILAFPVAAGTTARLRRARSNP